MVIHLWLYFRSLKGRYDIDNFQIIKLENFIRKPTSCKQIILKTYPQPRSVPPPPPYSEISPHLKLQDTKSCSSTDIPHLEKVSPENWTLFTPLLEDVSIIETKHVNLLYCAPPPPSPPPPPLRHVQPFPYILDPPPPGEERIYFIINQSIVFKMLPVNLAWAHYSLLFRGKGVSSAAASTSNGAEDLKAVTLSIHYARGLCGVIIHSSGSILINFILMINGVGIDNRAITKESTLEQNWVKKFKQKYTGSRKEMRT